jgi:hypothetical protein
MGLFKTNTQRELYPSPDICVTSPEVRVGPAGGCWPQGWLLSSVTGHAPGTSNWSAAVVVAYSLISLPPASSWCIVSPA